MGIEQPPEERLSVQALEKIAKSLYKKFRKHYAIVENNNGCTDIMEYAIYKKMTDKSIYKLLSTTLDLV